MPQKINNNIDFGNVAACWNIKIRLYSATPWEGKKKRIFVKQKQIWVYQQNAENALFLMYRAIRIDTLKIRKH